MKLRTAHTHREEDLRRMAYDEIRAYRVLSEKKTVPQLLCWFVAPSKDGKYQKFYTVFECAKHGSLFDARPTLHLSAKDLVGIVKSLLESARDVAAVGLVHGNVNPRSVLIYANMTAKLCDFGFTVPLGVLRSRLEEGCLLSGQEDDYICPELRSLLLGNKAQDDIAIGKVSDPRVDIWGLGQVIHFLLTGQTVKGPIDLSQVPCLRENQELLSFVTELLNDMLQTKVKKRPTAEALCQRFEQKKLF